MTEQISLIDVPRFPRFDPDWRIVWLDTETTGLNPSTEGILEVGVIITDAELNERARASWLVRPDNLSTLLDGMIQVVRDMHAKTGLISRVLREGRDPRDVERELALLITEHGRDLKKTRLAGRSIFFDRSMLAEHMPNVLRLCYHRAIDVSALKSIAEMWNVEAAEPYAGKVAEHTSIADLEDTLREFTHWRKHLLRDGLGPTLNS